MCDILLSKQNSGSMSILIRRVGSNHAQLTHIIFSSWITWILQTTREVTFGSLLPPEASRSTAAHTTYSLLGEEMLHILFLQIENVEVLCQSDSSRLILTNVSSIYSSAQ